MAEKAPTITSEVNPTQVLAERIQEKNEPISRALSSPSNKFSLSPRESRTALGKDDSIGNKDETRGGSSTSEEDSTEYPNGWRVTLVMIAIYLSAFLVAIVSPLLSTVRKVHPNPTLQDRTIVATAVPNVTNEFNSLGDVGWYGSSYMLTSCAFQLLVGKIYTFYSPRWVFLVQVLFFNVGSALSGAAPTSTALIIGRAISGIGAAGMNAGVVIILSHIVVPSLRPMCTGLLGAAFGVCI